MQISMRMCITARCGIVILLGYGPSLLKGKSPVLEVLGLVAL